MPHEGAAGHHQVRTRGIKSLVDKEILLLPAEIRHHMVHILVEIAGYAGGSLVDGIERTQQRGLEVERLTGI